MNKELLARLARITDEEQQILDGKAVDKALYTESARFVIDSAKMLTDGRLIDIRTNTRFVRFPRHTHNYVEIIYMCAGTTTHIVNGANEVVLETGNLLFLNQFSAHEILPAGLGDVAVNFMILPEFFDTALRMIDRDSMIGSFLISTLCRGENVGQYLHFKVADNVPIQNLIENLIWSIERKPENGPVSNRINETTMGLLFMTLMNSTQALAHSGAQEFDKRLLLRALEYIDGSYRDGTLTALARMTGQSIYRLSRLIKGATGATFKELLLQKRLGRACELLADTSLPVCDIIFSVGYDNTSFFFRAFRKKYGESPSEYRKHRQAKPCK
jgi:AraC-type DNA-binding domain-containing proteins